MSEMEFRSELAVAITPLLLPGDAMDLIVKVRVMGHHAKNRAEALANVIAIATHTVYTHTDLGDVGTYAVAGFEIRWEEDGE